MLSTSALFVLLALGGFADCNGNGVDDAIDILNGTSIDCDGDGTPDECQSCADCNDNGLLDSCEVAAGAGLVGQYWISTDGYGSFGERVLSRIDAQIDFDFGGGGPAPGMPSDDFAVRWTGMLESDVTGVHTLYTRTDDGVRLWVDGVLLIDKWVLQSPTEWTTNVFLQAGVPVTIRMDYFEAGGGAEARLDWVRPGSSRVPVPPSAFRPIQDADGDGVPDGCPDCNGNGVPDAIDIAEMTSADCNGNCVPDECDTAVEPPLAYWRFEGGSSQVLDSGPNGLAGTASETAPTFDVPTSPVPQTGEPNLLALDIGDAGRVIVPDAGGLLTMAGRSFTIEGWVRIDQLSGCCSNADRQHLVQKKVLASTNGQLDYAFLVQGANVQSGAQLNFGRTAGISGREMVLVFGDGSGSANGIWCVTSYMRIDETGWHHVSASLDVDLGEVRFGLDGFFEVIKVPLDAVVFHENSGPLVIGAHTNASGVFNQFLRGAVDEVRIHDGFLPASKLLLFNTGADCNANGIPDQCDVANGFSGDCDGDAIPDECEDDCNGNGHPDPCDIADGISLDCQPDGVPDECQLIEGDCNGNAVPDECEIEGADCNGNGVLDSCDIASGASEDCQGEGVPDDCQVAGAFDDGFDDGGAEYGIRSGTLYMTWLSNFQVDGDRRVIDEVLVSFAFIPIGQLVTVYVWSDPDGDGDPTDAQVISAGSDLVAGSYFFQPIDVADVDVGPPGTSYFIGVATTVTPQDFPASMDVSAPAVLGRCWTIGSAAPIDPNDLSAGVEEIALLEDALFPGKWLLRARLVDPRGDCNGNGVPDDCDIADGTSVDLDLNGVPDECEDCNANGVPDGLDIASGLSADCQGDGIPDECQLSFNDCDDDGVPDDCRLADADCNGNGVPDGCDIASGGSEDLDGTGVPDECEDCNDNGVLDSIDIALEFSLDCQADGVPDECQYGTPVLLGEYAYDDGTGDAVLGIGAPGEIAWMNHFVVEPGLEWIGAIRLAYGNVLPTLPLKAVLWSDPDGDGDPSDAQVLATADTTFPDGGSDELNDVLIPPTWVGPPGTSFFAGAYVLDEYGILFPIARDTSDPDGESWFALTLNGPLDLNELWDAELFGTFESAGFPSDAMVRAAGFAGELANDCNGNLVPDDCDIEDGTSADANGNDVPDECECMGDYDGSGSVDFDDVLYVLANWGNPHGFEDLLLVLAGWGDCPS